jgi:hypothetical protein
MPLGTSKLPEIAECQILWDPSGDNVDLGPYLGTASLKFEQESQEVKQSGFGNTAVDHRTSGKINLVLEFDATRQALAGWLNNIYGATAGVATASVEAVVGNKSGNSLYANAKDVYLKPLEDDTPSSDQSTWIHLYKCSEPLEAADLQYAIDAQQVITVQMKLYPSRDTADLGQFFSVGVD